MLNKCMVIGHLGADPEMRYTANGSAVTTFRVATSRNFTDGSGERREETEWFRVVTWNRLAETCAQYLTKGRLVYVEGRLQTRQWDDQQGQRRYTTELIAETVRFLGGGRDSGSGGGFASPGFATGPDNEGDIDPDDLPF
ncbi:MAG: single-stranded DNA-binding protein [Chloroflexi bacterium]|nr:single-stranded DNA-binding protein [Chloroflexota bacterium]